MLNLKKTAVAVLAFGSSAAFAGTMGPVCTAGNVTVPCERTAWDIGVEALYLQPTYSDLGSFIGSEVNATATTARYVENNPDWAWGFKLEGSYHFNTGNDLNLNWYHLGNKTSTRTYTGGVLSPAFLLPTLTNTTYSIRPAWDAVNLELGQHVDFAEFKNVRLHGGVQYARLKTEHAFVGVESPSRYAYAQSSKYNGFGPRLGADMNYGFGNGLGIYANGAGALLAGTSKSASTYTDNFGFAGAFRTTTSSRTTIVPELEAKLGVDYTFAMAQGDLTLDLGYMWVNYFNGNQVTTFLPIDTNVGFQGLIFGGKWVGSVA